MNEMISLDRAALEQKSVRELTDAVLFIAKEFRAAYDKLEAVERKIDRLRPVTQAQASSVNAEIRNRAASLAAMYRISGKADAVAALIRAHVRRLFGIRAMRELPACEFERAVRVIRGWNDFDALMKLRGKGDA